MNELEEFEYLIGDEVNIENTFPSIVVGHTRGFYNEPKYIIISIISDSMLRKGSLRDDEREIIEEYRAKLLD